MCSLIILLYQTCRQRGRSVRTGLLLAGASCQTAPTETEVNNKIADLDNSEAERLLRVERDKKLSALDWEVVKAYSSGVAVSTELKTYMQALRDLPASASPKLDSNYNLDDSSVTWPTR